MTIKIKRGIRENLPVLQEGEFGFCTDTKEIFIGSSMGNLKVYPAEIDKVSPVVIEESSINGNVIIDGQEITVYDDFNLQQNISDKADIEHSHSLSELVDVDSSSIKNGYLLMFDQNQGKWIGVNPSSLNIGGEENPPQAVTNLTVTNITESSLTLSWIAPENTISYDIEKDGEFLANVSSTTYNVIGLEQGTSYKFSVIAKNDAGTSLSVDLTVETLFEVDDNLVFNVDFSGKSGFKDNIVYDSVNNLPCTLYNVAHDETDGFLNNKGLLIKLNGYVDIPSNTGALYDSIDINTSGVTFEFVAYDATGITFRTDNPTSVRAYISNVVNINYRYLATDETEKNGGNGHSWFVDPYGVETNRSPLDSLHGKDELNVIAVRFHPNGICDMVINGRYGLNTTNIPSDFQRYADILGSGKLFIRRNQVALNSGSTVLKSFSIFNKVLTNEETLQRYTVHKTSEPIDNVNVHPTEIEMEPGENRVLAVVASPKIYTNFLSSTFESGNAGFVTVEQNGMLSGITNGDTQVSVTSDYEGQTFVNYIPVSVGSSTIELPSSTRTINGISLNRQTEILAVGGSFIAMASTLPFDVFDDNVVIWESSNPSVCTVNFGVLGGISEGTSVITAYDGTKTYSKSFTVTVYEPVGVIITAEETYNVPLSEYGIQLDNTDSMNTTNGIQSAMDYASDNGYKKIVFPLGTYLLTPIARTLYLPTEMIVNFSDSVLNIELSSKTATGYTMFRFEHVSNTKLINAKIYGEADFTTLSGSTEKCITLIISDAYNSGIENCTISKSPGFNIATHNSLNKTGTMGTGASKDNFQAGSIDENTGVIDDSIITNIFRSINFIDISQLGDYYMLGYTQGYFGYPHLRSRLYSIFFYDGNYNFIESHMHNLQFYNYGKPVNCKYVKIVIYQENAPTTHDTDFSATAMLRTVGMPLDCFIRNCIIEENFSCGVALTGGQGWIIEGNSFSRNGKRMPACDIDWEDGWEASVGDICKNNTFNSKSGVIISGGGSLAFYNNIFNQSHLHVWSRTQNFRIYNNFFNGKGDNRNLNLACQAESCFANNILSGVSYNPPSLHHPSADYRIRLTNNTLL